VRTRSASVSIAERRLSLQVALNQAAPTRPRDLRRATSEEPLQVHRSLPGLKALLPSPGKTFLFSLSFLLPLLFLYGQRVASDC
jgi:hypothetical protein